MPRLLKQSTNDSNKRSLPQDINTHVSSIPRTETEPTVNDILSGRGKHNFHHHGNKKFLSLVKHYKFKEGTCPKSLKPVYAKAIYTSLRKLEPPARFLKASSQGDEIKWYEMSEKEAMLKIRQAMRDYEAREQRKQVITTAMLKRLPYNAQCQVNGREDAERGIEGVHTKTLKSMFHMEKEMMRKSLQMYGSPIAATGIASSVRKDKLFLLLQGGQIMFPTSQKLLVNGVYQNHMNMLRQGYYMNGKGLRVIKNNFPRVHKMGSPATGFMNHRTMIPQGGPSGPHNHYAA